MVFFIKTVFTPTIYFFDGDGGQSMFLTVNCHPPPLSLFELTLNKFKFQKGINLNNFSVSDGLSMLSDIQGIILYVRCLLN